MIREHIAMSKQLENEPTVPLTPSTQPTPAPSEETSVVPSEPDEGTFMTSVIPAMPKNMDLGLKQVEKELN